MAGGGGDSAWGNATGAPGSSTAAPTVAPCTDEDRRPGGRCEPPVSKARREINEAVAASVLQEAPKVIENVQAIFDNVQVCKSTRDSIISSLIEIFGDVDIGPWLDLGSEQYFTRRADDIATMRSYTYQNTSPITWRGQARANQAERDGDRTWDQYADSRYTSRLNQTTLGATAVQEHLWGEVLEASSGHGLARGAGNNPTKGPWDSLVYTRSYRKWSWVSELDETFTLRVPEWGAYDMGAATSFLTEGQSFGAAHMFANIEATASTTERASAGVLTQWPFGWLTTLETVMAIIGYYMQAADQELLENTSVRSGPTYNTPYALFTAADIRHLQGSGDPEAGWNSIMDANHSNLRSWTKEDKLPYHHADPLEGINTPENFVIRSFNEASGGMCGEDGMWKINGAWTSAIAGQSESMRQHRPYSILTYGGVLNQGIWNSPNTVSPERSANNYFARWETSVVGNFVVRLAAKLRRDGQRFRTLASLLEGIDPTNMSSASEEQQQTAAGIMAMYSKLMGQTSLGAASDADIGFGQQEFIRTMESGVYEKLGRLLDSVASFADSTLRNMQYSHALILDSHRITIKATCDAIDDVAGAFNDNDAWYNIFDDSDDWMEEATREGIGNPFSQLGEAMIGTGATNVMFKEQCFLLSFVSDFAISKARDLDRGNNSEPASKRLPYYQSTANVKSLDNNATVLMDGGSYGFLNRLTQNPKLTRFYNALNHELSNLQPKIRLWKVIFDEEGNEQEVEIKFESHFSAADLDMFKNSAARGVGAGLKSFNFIYDGSNPFSVKKSIKANLKIFANTMSEILRDRPSHYVDAQGALQPTTYKYSDLAMKTWNTAEVNAADMEEGAVPTPCSAPAFDLLSENTEKAELNFRLKAEVGFSQPINQMSSMHEDLREALAESFVTLNLTPTVHNFEIDEMGRVVFNLNFLAYIEQFFDQAMFNVFSSADVELSRMYRNLMMKYYNSQGCSSEQISQQKEDFATVVKTESEMAIASLIGDMMTEDLIYYVNLPYEQITSFLSYGPHSTYEDFVGGAVIRSNAQHNEYLKTRVNNALSTAFGDDSDSGVPESEQNQIQAALLGNDPREADLSFFYLSDLIDLILVKIETGISNTIENIDTISDKPGGNVISCEEKLAKKKDYRNAQKNLKKLRIMLGPMELTHPRARDGHTSLHVNLGDCPISVKYFVEWLTSKMLQKDEVSYNLTKFVNDLINNLIRNFLNNDQCFGYSVSQKTRLNQSAISSYGAHPTYDPVTLQAVSKAESTLAGAAAAVRAAAAEATADVNASDARQTWASMRGLVARSTARAAAREANKASFRAHLGDFSEMPVLNPSGPSNSARTSMPVSNEYNYFVYFAGRVMPTELMKGEKQSDEENFGIFHYMLGRDRGLVKNIKLTKTQTKGLAEVRFEQSGYDGLQQLRVTYDAQVDMFASVNTFPGTYIYIDPRGFAPEGSGDENFRLTALGIGGYYMIVRSEHEFAEGKANTILHTKWVNQVDGDEEERQTQMAANSSGTGDVTSRRCSITLREDPEAEMPETGGFMSMLGF